MTLREPQVGGQPRAVRAGLTSLFPVGFAFKLLVRVTSLTHRPATFAQKAKSSSTKQQFAILRSRPA